MPPGRHSSSSHHSSHSHSSSHHSFHSSSSHSSGSFGFGGSRGSVNAPLVFGNGPSRPKKNQPTSYPVRRFGYKPPTYHNYRNHSYTYYNKGWTDKALGKTYDKGYYDEEGNHYKNLVIRDIDLYTTQCECDYCGTKIKLKWKVGALPNCPNCGATLNILEDAAIDFSADTTTIKSEKDDKLAYKPYELSSVEEAAYAPALSGFKIFISIVASIALLLSPVINTFRNQDFSESERESEQLMSQIQGMLANVKGQKANFELWGESFYVESIGRTVTWKSTAYSYYDAETDCYIYYNTDVEPNVWQYWYEDISSNFGDYGWMEYELAEDQWYIEQSEGRWIKLPVKYFSNDLWHMSPEQAGSSYIGLDNTYLFGNKVTIDGYSFEWNDVTQSYSNRYVDCNLWYNTDVYPFVWQYYYPSISDSEEFKDFGWMEYNKTEGQWYIENKDGWIPLPDKFDGDSLWHINNEPAYNITE